MIQTALKEVGIDFPQPGETIAPGEYSFRVAAPVDAQEVRISIDDEAWQACRQSNGHWYFDWNNQSAGDHVAVSRVIESDGSILVTQPRLFRVQPR
jgi:membrane protein implicated in regulation of membrane protease activity